MGVSLINVISESSDELAEDAAFYSTLFRWPTIPRSLIPESMGGTG